jgi:hypothetical protein
MPQPFIGITDFMTREQSLKMLSVLRDCDPMYRRRLGIGVMTSWKQLNGHKSKWADAFPKKEDIANVFVHDKDAYNVLHYADYDGHAPVSGYLEVVRHWGGPALDAIQLDMVWPEPSEVKLFRRRHPAVEIVLQVNSQALEQVANNAELLCSRLSKYGKSITYVLLDKSMGQGKGMNAHELLPFAMAIEQNLPHLALAAAGGLGPNTLSLIEPLAYELPGISCDAQSKLRQSGSALEPVDWTMAEQYLRCAAKYFADNWFDRR